MRALSCGSQEDMDEGADFKAKDFFRQDTKVLPIKKMSEFVSSKFNIKPGVVVPTCNPSNSGGLRSSRWWTGRSSVN
uniref:Uncharacterized protein n=1 Tax=Spermophilus dauricus TaxID=99837 RepID=A0A8C9UVZ4_SPEDA